MAYEIDTEKLNDPSLQILDIGRPPVRQIPHQHFPKMVYLHPKDKTKEHRTQIVHTDDELDRAQKQGWKTKPHIPVEKVEDLSEHFEAEAPVAAEEKSIDDMSREELVAEVKRRGITTVDGRSKTEALIEALKA